MLIKSIELAEKLPLKEAMRYVEKIPKLVEKTTSLGNRAYKSGIYPKEYLLNPKGKWVSKKHSSAYELSDAKTAAGETLQQNYENAMHRRRSYTYQGVRDFGQEYPARAIKDPLSNSFLIDAPARSPIFHPTHFSPETLRGGSRLIKEAAVSSQPIVFTVTDDLAPMLQKSGFVEIGQIPQIFNGEYVTKHILANKSTGEHPQLIARTLKQGRVRGVKVGDIVKTIKAAPEPTYKSIIQNGVLVSPESLKYIKDSPMQGFTFKDLIKPSK